jgi:hypothetical protein
LGGGVKGLWSTTPKCSASGSLAFADARSMVNPRSGSQYAAMLTKMDISGGRLDVRDDDRDEEGLPRTWDHSGF